MATDGAECSESEQQNNAEYIPANKKLASAHLSFLLSFFVDFSTRPDGGNCGKSFGGSLPAHFVCTCRQFASERSNSSNMGKKYKRGEHFCGRFAVDFIMPTFNCRKSMPRWPPGAGEGCARGHVLSISAREKHAFHTCWGSGEESPLKRQLYLRLLSIV